MTDVRQADRRPRRRASPSGPPSRAPRRRAEELQGGPGLLAVRQPAARPLSRPLSRSARARPRRRHRRSAPAFSFAADPRAGARAARPRPWLAAAISALLVGYALRRRRRPARAAARRRIARGEWLDHMVDAAKVSSLHIAVAVAAVPLRGLAVPPGARAAGLHGGRGSPLLRDDPQRAAAPAAWPRRSTRRSSRRRHCGRWPRCRPTTGSCAWRSCLLAQPRAFLVSYTVLFAGTTAYLARARRVVPPDAGAGPGMTRVTGRATGLVAGAPRTSALLVAALLGRFGAGGGDERGGPPATSSPRPPRRPPRRRPVVHHARRHPAPSARPQPATSSMTRPRPVQGRATTLRPPVAPSRDRDVGRCRADSSPGVTQRTRSRARDRASSAVPGLP